MDRRTAHAAQFVLCNRGRWERGFHGSGLDEPDERAAQAFAYPVAQLVLELHTRVQNFVQGVPLASVRESIRILC